LFFITVKEGRKGGKDRGREEERERGKEGGREEEGRKLDGSGSKACFLM
jgi:hypothetical protein